MKNNGKPSSPPDPPDCVLQTRRGGAGLVGTGRSLTPRCGAAGLLLYRGCTRLGLDRPGP
ncbi:hypothetical protein E2C01_073006 [Portunus trituberculatus]|uniref:Uncharacterized protein n=1 Tax=Portunus trituberculatus TaxID=210409 RepID=A0A5B7IC74_PORTR|nr:hypothetical protein [Portunus trituberculatus]